MQLISVSIKNFRRFSELVLDLDGNSIFVVGSNASGKTTLFVAIQHALRGGSVTPSDFFDLQEPLEIVATVTGIPAEDQRHFAEAMDFSERPPVLRVGLRAIWNEEEQESESTHGFPDDGWKRVGRQARAALPLLVLPAWRDPQRLTSMTGRSSILNELLRALPVQHEMEQAARDIAAAGEALAATQPIQDLLGEAGLDLGKFLPDVDADPFSLSNAGSQQQDVLKQLELHLDSGGAAASIAEQSSGLAQAVVFAMSLRQLASTPGSLLLVDEPEIALHPQAQRALVSTLRSRAGQSIVATHSAAVLDRVDPRQVTRLKSNRGRGTAVRASRMSDADAFALSRYATSQTAEAFFAKALVVVEGFSDLLALRTLTKLRGKDLDASGVSLLSLDGSGTFKHYLQLFGPEGLGVELRGLCDQDAERDWIEKLSAAGIGVADRASLEGNGFFVCDPDLETEMLSALDSIEITRVINEDGAESTFSSFASHPANSGLTEHEIQVAFFKNEKVRWAPLFAAAMSPTALPQPIERLLSLL